MSRIIIYNSLQFIIICFAVAHCLALENTTRSHFVRKLYENEEKKLQPILQFYRYTKRILFDFSRVFCVNHEFE